MLTETTGRLTSVLCRGSASLPPQSTASFLPVHFAPRCPRSMANPQLSCKKTSSIRVEKNAFISCQLVHNQTNFASSGLEPSSKYSCVGNPFVDDWMQRGDSGLTFDSQKRGSYFLQCLGPRTGLHSNLVFIGTRTSLKKHSKYAHICYLLCSHNSPLMSGKNKQNFSVRLLCRFSVSHSVVSDSATPCNPMDCSPPGSYVLGISTSRILEWVAIPFSRGSSLMQGLNRGLLQYKQERPMVKLFGMPVKFARFLMASQTF